MRRHAWVLGITAFTGLLAGCVEHRYVVTSDPPGATVLRNGQPIGVTPVDDHFTYYGKYHLTLIKDGFETLQVDQKIPAPWYEYVPLDFVSEGLLPFHVEDVHRFNYQLQPRQPVNPNTLLQQAGDLRGQGQAIGPPPGSVIPPAAPAPPPPPATPPGTLYQNSQSP